LNSAYNFNGSSNYIFCGNFGQLSNNVAPIITFSYWIKYDGVGGDIFDLRAINNSNFGNWIGFQNPNSFSVINFNAPAAGGQVWISNQSIENQAWTHILTEINFTTGNVKIYQNGLLSQFTIANPTSVGNLNNPKLNLGSRFDALNGRCCYFGGILDDFCIFNRALTQQEISALYNAINCANDLSITPTNSQNTGTNAILNATSTDQNPVYRWQSDLGLGFQDLSNYGQYSGVGSNSLQVSNLQLRNHQQKFRVISTSGNCVDTSALATISLNDTCINVVNDTNLVTVTDTLIITITATPGLVQNTLKAYPNPVAGMLFINTGNYAAMPGYSIRISTSTGQEVYNAVVNQPLMQVPLASLAPEGLFYLMLYDVSGALVTTRKIVLAPYP
jgi:hypothetical protein